MMMTVTHIFFLVETWNNQKAPIQCDFEKGEKPDLGKDAPIEQRALPQPRVLLSFSLQLLVVFDYSVCLVF